MLFVSLLVISPHLFCIKFVFRRVRSAAGGAGADHPAGVASSVQFRPFLRPGSFAPVAVASARAAPRPRGEVPAQTDHPARPRARTSEGTGGAAALRLYCWNTVWSASKERATTLAGPRPPVLEQVGQLGF